MLGVGPCLLYSKQEPIHGLPFSSQPYFVICRIGISRRWENAQSYKSSDAFGSSDAGSKFKVITEAEIASDNYFHTVLEAMKSVTSKIRSLTGIYADGAELVDLTLSGANPCLAINPLKTKSEIGEQKGFVNLLKGLYGTFRNPTAHEPKIEWPVSEEDALDVLSVLSYVHRKLDKAHRI